uniref:Uncharacterized protein n=1 Tax=Romanomermis culicivorax TaxID=13658 RepID=A0A915I1G3_ROMCU
MGQKKKEYTCLDAWIVARLEKGIAPRRCLAEVWSLDMVHPLLGMVGLGGLKKCVFCMSLGPYRTPLEDRGELTKGTS